MGWGDVNPLFGGYTFDCKAYNLAGGVEQGVLSGVSGAEGSIPFVTITDSLDSIGLLAGSFISITYIVASDLSGISKIEATDWVYPIIQEQIWISKINTVDFTLDKTDEAVRLMIPHWQGIIHQTMKLENKVIVYGENGVASLNPFGLKWGVKNIVSTGILGRNAVTGNEDIHYFIGKNRFFYKMTPSGIEFTDYSNQFASLNTTVVLNLDAKKNLVYISDGSIGFIYSSSGLGKGIATITGLGIIENYLAQTESSSIRFITESGDALITEDGKYLVEESSGGSGANTGSGVLMVAPSTVIYDPFEIWTDILDFSSRDDKTISNLHFGTDVTEDLYGAIAYRWNKAKSFFYTPWIKSDQWGIVPVMASGIEFKIGARVKTYTPIKLDYINVQVKYSELKAIA